MHTRIFSLAFLTAALILPCPSNAALAQARSSALAKYDPSAPAEPLFATIPRQPQTTPHAPGVQLAQWSSNFIDLTGKTVNFTMVGGNALNSNATTTIPVLIVPIKLVFPKSNGGMTFDPNSDTTGNGDTVTDDVLSSPLFNNLSFIRDGTNLGTTQYIDAFQRGNFWYTVNGDGGAYHVLLAPTVLAEATVTVTSANGKIIPNPWSGGNKVALLDNKWYNDLLQNLMKHYAQINPGVLPLFLTDNTFVLRTDGKCCLGGYHSSNGTQPGGQTYATSTYATQGTFCEDVSCLSHELGEWMDDPFLDNHVNCPAHSNALLEVGDPLLGHVYPYELNGKWFFLQDLAFIGYFGAPSWVSLNSWLSFQNGLSQVCPGQ